MQTISVKERFFRKAIPEPNTGCWLWEGYEPPNKYGKINIKGKQKLAHRVSYEINIGSIPDGMNVLHKCDQPACVNPDHLFIGTQQDNIDDMWAKNRFRHASLKTHCINGHEFSVDNTRIVSQKRVCLTCRRANGRIYDRKRRG
jgi:hypothetical protein